MVKNANSQHFQLQISNVCRTKVNYPMGPN